MCGYRGRGITKALIKKFQPVRNFPGRLKNIYLLEDCLSMVLELEDNSQNENLKQEQMNIIQQALEQLSPQRRKVFEMKVSGKYSNQEIADKLNLSINTIKFQYSQSLKQIRATVGELSLLLLYCMM